MSQVQHFADTVVVNAAPAQVFAFYTDVQNLMRMIAPQLHVKLVRADLPLRPGSRVEFEVGPRSMPFTIAWVSEIAKYEQDAYFEDRMVSGPFSHWVHRHRFSAREDGLTAVHDEIEVSRPTGLLGRMLLSDGDLDARVRGLFDYRKKVLTERFGAPTIS